MSRTVPAGLAADLSSGKTTLARCIRFDLRDGTSLGMTTLNEHLSVNLGDGAITYRADVGGIPSAVQLTLGMEADSLEVRGPIGAGGNGVTRQAVLGGRFNRARARLFDVNFNDTTEFMRILAGKVSSARVEGGEFVLEVRSQVDAYNQTIGRVLSPQCSNDFGVDDPPRSYCEATPSQWTATVTTVLDDMRFEVDWLVDPDEDDIRNGLVTFTSGELLGTLPVEVFAYAGSPVALELYHPLVEPPQVGDALTVTEGCDKLRTTCMAKGQILNFRGFPDLVGSDQYWKMPIPGESSGD